MIAGVGRPTNKCYDRPDTFLFYLNNFFEHKESVFKEVLQSFNFNDLYYSWQDLKIYTNTVDCFMGLIKHLLIG